jgi:hypothetical protein
LIPVFEVADSSTREISQIFKGVEFGEFDLLTLGGKDLSPCLREREREREREHWIGCLVFFLKDTD